MVKIDIKFVASSSCSLKDLSTFFKEIKHWGLSGWKIVESSCFKTDCGFDVMFTVTINEKQKNIIEKVREYVSDIEKWVPWKLLDMSIIQSNY